MKKGTPRLLRDVPLSGADIGEERTPYHMRELVLFAGASRSVEAWRNRREM